MPTINELHRSTSRHLGTFNSYLMFGIGSACSLVVQGREPNVALRTVSSIVSTVDGQNPGPILRTEISAFIGFHVSQLKPGGSWSIH